MHTYTLNFQWPWSNFKSKEGIRSWHSRVFPPVVTLMWYGLVTNNYYKQFVRTQDLTHFWCLSFLRISYYHNPCRIFLKPSVCAGSLCNITENWSLKYFGKSIKTGSSTSFLFFISRIICRFCVMLITPGWSKIIWGSTRPDDGIYASGSEKLNQ